MGGTAAASTATAVEEEESGGGAGGGVAVDASVGTIVWVRRRNGSWWPGRILGPEELPESMVMSPRTGTPVKLLGREDASVDWYNLEKSKRIKAFRCGEFDACIEKAEALQGNPTRKREKYARREDAILHALELEKKQMMERNPQLQALQTPSKFVGSKSSDAFRRGLHKHSLKEESSVFEEDDMGEYLSRLKGSKKLGVKEDASAVLPRTRGLQDFGLRISSSKNKLSQHSTWDGLQKSDESAADAFSEEFIGGNLLSENRKKRLQGGLGEGSLKRRDRRRPLVQVLQNSAKLSVSHPRTDNDGETISLQGSDNLGAICKGKRSPCIYVPADLSNGVDQFGYHFEEIPTAGTHLGMEDNLQNSDSSSEETETTSSGFHAMKDSGSSEREFTRPENAEFDNISSGSGMHVTSGSSSFHIRDKSCGVTNEDMQLPCFDPQLNTYEQPMYGFADTGVSKWHMKGKRNIRNLAKRSLDVGEKNFFPQDKFNGFSEGSLKNDNSLSVSKKTRVGFSNQMAGASMFYNEDEDLNGNLFCNDDDVIDKNFGHRELFGFGRCTYPLTLKTAKEHGRSHSTFNDSEEDSFELSPQEWEFDESSHAARMAAYWGYSGRRRDVVDVVLKVQASNTGSHGEREHVPLVSLMSRLNGKAIVGHPIQIEILEDGSTFPPASRVNAIPEEGPASPPTWRTARRTTMQRVPRANASRSELEGDDPDSLEAPILQTRPLKKSYSSHLYQESSVVFKKSSSRKTSGKKVSLSNQKTRKLSALASEQRRRESRNALGGLIKRGGPVPLLTCVPVKVVFSRLLESIGRPSSSAIGHRLVPKDPL